MGTDQTIFDSAQLEVRDPDFGSFNSMIVIAIKSYLIASMVKVWSCRWRRE